MAKNKVWWGILFRVLSFLCLVTPIAVWILVNRKELFTTHTSTSIALGVVIGLGLFVMLIVKLLKTSNKYLTTATYIVIGVLLTWFLSTIDIKPVMNYLFWVFVCGGIGFAFFWPLSATADKLLLHYNTYKEERIRVEARREARAESEDAFI